MSDFAAERLAVALTIADKQERQAATDEIKDDLVVALAEPFAGRGEGTGRSVQRTHQETRTPADSARSRAY